MISDTKRLCLKACQDKNFFNIPLGYSTFIHTDWQIPTKFMVFAIFNLLFQYCDTYGI